jgi:hypothetical protein
VRLRNIMVFTEAKLIRKALKEYILAEMNDANVWEIATLMDGERTIQAQKFDAVVLSSDLLRDDARQFFGRMKESSHNGKTPVIVLDATPTEGKTSIINAFGFPCYTIPLSMTDRLRSTLNNVCNPRKWREQDRISISNTKVTLHLEDGLRIEGDLINLSRSGVLCSFRCGESRFNPFQAANLSLHFPEDYDRLVLDRLPCRLVQVQVISWQQKGTPDEIRLVWQLKRLTDSQQDLLNHVFQIY